MPDATSTSFLRYVIVWTVLNVNTFYVTFNPFCLDVVLLAKGFNLLVLSRIELHFSSVILSALPFKLLDLLL